MSDYAIEITNLEKSYRVYSRPIDLLLEAFGAQRDAKVFRALSDISFKVKKGEVVGIIGRNGAGKSTLLKIITGTLDKTSGEVSVDGKVSAILELGTGFHPEYSGRENIILGGMCLGMSRSEVMGKIDSIIDFSELHDFIDQPFKTYSSGMQARLTFATAISVNPEILIIDEALAAGDMFFAEKCYRRIREITKSGTTVLFVTHSLPIIYELCDSAILLNRGEMVSQGHPRQIGHQYECIMLDDREKSRLRGKTISNVSKALPVEVDAVSIPEAGALISEDQLMQYQTDKARIDDLSIISIDGEIVSALEFGHEYFVVVKIIFVQDLEQVNVSFRFDNPNGIRVTGYNTIFDGVYISGKRGEVKELRFRFNCNLSNGVYRPGACIAKPLSMEDPLSDFEQIFIYNPKVSFSVLRNHKNLGFFDLDCKISQPNTV